MQPPSTLYVFGVTTGEHRFLAFRNAAAQNRERLEKELAAHPETEDLIIDFQGVAAVTNLYVDELVGKFYVALAAGDAGVSTAALAGLTAETRDAVAICLARRKFAALDADLGVLIGEAAALEQTFSCAAELGDFRAGDIAAALGITLTNANNRLKRLACSGAVHRVPVASPANGGRQFQYRVPRSLRAECVRVP